MFKKFLLIGFAGLLIGIGINLFLLPFHLLNGGIFGIGLLLNYLWGLKLGFIITLLNTPIYLLALKYDQAYFFNSLYGTLITSVSIDLLVPLNGIIQLPILLSAFLGGLFIGTGVGLMLRQNICPGGIDLLALLISKRYSINPGIIIFIIDSCILLSGLLIFKEKQLFYSLFTILSVGCITVLLTTFKSVNIYLK